MKKTFAIGAAAVLLSACGTLGGSSGPSASATLQPASGSQVRGKVTFTQIAENRVRVTGEISGHTPGPKGFHLHEKGDCSAPDAMSAGPHFNPLKKTHGATTTTGHAGDMGNLTFNASGGVTIDMVIDGVSVSRDAPNGIIGRGVVVHAQPDDLKSDPAGNAGARVACGVIS